MVDANERSVLIDRSMVKSDESSIWIDRGTPMLTTYDNPYDPFTEFSKWYVYDTVHGYDCCGYIGRMAGTSPGFTDPENNYAIEQAIDNLIAVDFLHRYRKVFNNPQ